MRSCMFSKVRCPWAGSCDSETCSQLATDAFVPELYSTSFRPGYNFCREVSGFIPLGCLLPSSACLFYRIFAIPTDSKTYELIRCPTWQYELYAVLKLEKNGEKPLMERMFLVPGQSHHWSEANITLTASPMGQPPLPILGEKFALNETHATIVSFPFPLMHCPNEAAARRFDCIPDLRACSECHEYPGARIVNCTCGEFNLDRIFKRGPMLPIQINQLKLYHERRGNLTLGTVKATVPNAPVNLVLRMDRMR